MTIRLLIADDHAVVRQGLRLFMEVDDEIRVIGEAGTGREAVDLARETRPDVVLMDLSMPGMDGIAATRLIRAEHPQVEVIALTGVPEDSSDASVVRAVRAGAVGYLPKTADAAELRRAVHAAAAGQTQLSTGAANRLVREVSAPTGGAVLTPREKQVLDLLAGGKANKEIARDLGIGEQTVKTYVSNILGKLGVHSRTQAAVRAAHQGLTTEA